MAELPGQTQSIRTGGPYNSIYVDTMQFNIRRESVNIQSDPLQKCAFFSKHGQYIYTTLIDERVGVKIFKYPIQLCSDKHREIFKYSIQLCSDKHREIFKYSIQLCSDKHREIFKYTRYSRNSVDTELHTLFSKLGHYIEISP